VSADNWARCPRCRLREERKLNEEQSRVDAAYGKVPVDEFDQMRTELAAKREAFVDGESTFREDYEFYGAEDGIVTASYRGQCTKCGLILKFEDAHAIEGIES